MKYCSRIPYKLFTIALLASASVHAKRVPVDRSVVTVNDDIILESDIEAFRQKSKSKNFQDLFGGIDPKKLNDRKSVLNLLIEEKIIDQQVKKLELNVSNVEIDRHIRSILERNGITEAQLKVRLKDLGTSFAEYRDGIRRQLERQNLLGREIKPMMEVSDEELRHFMARQGDADTNRRYHLAHILIAGKGPKVKARAEKVLGEALSNPEDFTRLAKEYSDDQATASAGGDLGAMNHDAMLTQFHQAVKTTTAGHVYPKVIQSPGGLHILKVVSTEALSFASLPEEKKAELRNQLMGQELEKKMALWLDRKKSEAHIRFAAGEVK
ncbi:peptidylprolyl isomerase [bacterium]|nr:peptidylprolyl isomerase [bacterium]